MVHILFICNQGRHRSKTAAELFQKEFSTQYAGLYAEKPLSENQMAWADVVVVMEDFQRQELVKRFPKLALQKRVITLDVPDVYQYGQSELKDKLKEQMDQFF